MAEKVGVLIVENDEDDAILVQEQLRQEGFDVEFERVETAEALKAALRKESWQVVISDFVMPRLNGREALRIVKESGLDVPFIIVSGSIGEETAVEVMREGAHDYVLKDNLARLGPAVRRELLEARERAERRRSEAALDDASAQMLLAQHAAGVITWDLDLKTRLVRWSEEIYRLLGQEPGPRHRPFDEFFKYIHPDDREHARAAAERSIQDGTHLDLEFRIIRPDGSVRWLLSRAVVFRDAGGRPNRMLGLNMDVTDRKESEARLAAKNKELEKNARELYQSNKELERFAYVAAHDLQEPLRMVASYSQLLLRTLGTRVDEVPVAEQYVGVMRGGIQRMEQLIDGLLSYSRVVHQDEQDLQTVDADSAVEEACAHLQQLIDDQQASVSHGRLPTVRADHTQLVQIFQNLLSNAIKYRKKEVPPIVHVSAEQKADRWVFAVRDNGIGIAPEHHERIFVIFKRLHREEYPGLGIGLASTQRLVELHGGSIWVESLPGQGSTFYFTLPIRLNTSPENITASDA